MLHVSTDINQLTRESAIDPDFPHAPPDWTRKVATSLASEEGLDLSEDHWETIRALQHFHAKGGLKYLYTLFPGGPIAQSCRLAGLKAPFIATDPSFGSVA
jgi:sulfur relay (sulfurtransferase) DsrC/TusE family protein